MTEPRRFTILDLLLFLGVLVLAIGVRIGYLTLCTDTKHPQGWLFVQDMPPAPASADKASSESEPSELDTLAGNIEFDTGFISKAPFANKEEPTAHTAPGFPVLLGLLARIVAPGSRDNTVQWIQVFVGALTAGLYFLFARRAFRSTMVALLAGVLTAIYPLWVINTTAINDGTLTTFLLALVLYLGVRAGQSGGAFSSLFFGLMLAALALTRAYYFPFTVVALAWFLLRSRLLPSWGWLCAAVAFLGFVIGMAPWTVRNYQLFGEPVPVADSAVYHLWIGNNPQATGGPVTDSMMHAAESTLREKDAQKLGALEQPERYSQLGLIVSDQVRDDPAKVVRLRIWSALYFFLGEMFFSGDGVVVEQAEDAPDKGQNVRVLQAVPGLELVQADDAANKDAEQTIANSIAGQVEAWLRYFLNLVVLITLVLMLGFAFLGWRWTYAWRKESLPASLAMIWIPLPYLLTHAEALHGPRLPLDGVLLCYAAFAVCSCMPFLGGYLLAGSAAVKREGA